jgi:hypothetical protein
VATALRLAYTESGGNVPLCHTAADRSVCSGDKAHARHGMAPALDVRWLQPGRRLVILTAERLVRALRCTARGAGGGVPVSSRMYARHSALLSCCRSFAQTVPGAQAAQGLWLVTVCGRTTSGSHALWSPVAK